jgi:hypothetical protein
VAYRGSDGGEGGRVDGGRGELPVVLQPSQAQGLHGCPQRGGHDLVQSGQCPRRVVPEAEHRAGRGLQGHRDREGLVVVEQHWRQGVPGAEPVAAVGAVDGGDRVVELAQGFDVAADGAFAGSEPGGQLAQRPLPS